MTVYVLQPEAIAVHEVVGVFDSHEAAEEHARDLWERSDAHHSYRITPVELNVGYDYAHRYHGQWRGPLAEEKWQRRMELPLSDYDPPRWERP